MSWKTGLRISIFSALSIACAHTWSRPAMLRGWVSDAACAATHTDGRGADCVRKCLRGGALVGHPEWKAQAMVFVADPSRRVLVVDNPSLLQGSEGQHVSIMARERDGHLTVIRRGDS